MGEMRGGVCDSDTLLQIHSLGAPSNTSSGGSDRIQLSKQILLKLL